MWRFDATCTQDYCFVWCGFCSRGLDYWWFYLKACYFVRAHWISFSNTQPYLSTKRSILPKYRPDSYIRYNFLVFERRWFTIESNYKTNNNKQQTKLPKWPSHTLKLWISSTKWWKHPRASSLWSISLPYGECSVFDILSAMSILCMSLHRSTFPERW